MTDTTTAAGDLLVVNGEGLDVRLARMEGKLDLAVAQLTPKLEEHGARIGDHEARVRALEARQTVTPLGLWSTVVGVVAVSGGLFAIADRFVQFTP